jgi:DNA-binding MarR family transcriptional regulator
MKHPASKTIGYQLMHVARLHRARTARLLEGLGLFPGQEQVIEALATQESMSMSELADVLRVRPPTASKTIARLSTLGLVERRTADGDGRVVRVALTQEGREMAEAVEALALDIEAEVVADLDARERRRLRKLIRRVERSLRAALGRTGADEDGAVEVSEDEA